MPERTTPPSPLSATTGDPAQWVDRYGDALLRYAAGRVASRELAEDLVQEAFLSAYRHRAEFAGESAFGTWLVAILRRKIIDYHRRSGRAPDADAAPLSAVDDPFTAKGRWTSSASNWRASPHELAENAEFWTVFQGCLAGLPLHLAEAFRMRELRVLSADDASRALGVTPRNLAVRLHRARLLLRQCLDKKWFLSDRGGAR